MNWLNGEASFSNGLRLPGSIRLTVDIGVPMGGLLSPNYRFAVDVKLA